MDIYVYLYVRGEEFSPTAFQGQLDKQLQGSVQFHKRVREGVVEWFNEYWMSPHLEAVDHEDAIAKLHNLVSQLHPELLQIRGDEITIKAELVSYCRDENKFHGFYLPHETIKLLAEVGASLDIDQYYRVYNTETEIDPI